MRPIVRKWTTLGAFWTRAAWSIPRCV
jgi:hypothetical protein